MIFENTLWPKFIDALTLHKSRAASLAIRPFGTRDRFLSIRKYSNRCWYYYCVTCRQPGKYSVIKDTWKVFTLLHAQNVLFPVANYNSAADDRAAEFINFSWLLRSSDSNLTFFICNYNLDNGEACKTHRWTLLSISCVFLIVVSSTKDGYLAIHKLNSELKSKLKWYRLFLLYRKKRQKKRQHWHQRCMCTVCP